MHNRTTQTTRSCEKIPHNNKHTKTQTTLQTPEDQHQTRKASTLHISTHEERPVSSVAYVPRGAYAINLGNTASDHESMLQEGRGR